MIHSLSFNSECSHVTGQMAGGRGEFAHWRAGDGRIFAMRDPLGVVPLYYIVTENGFKFSTRLRSLVENADRLTLNKKYLQGLAWQYFGARNETPFQEIRRLPAGHYLLATQEQLTIRPYCNLHSTATPGNLPRAVAEAVGRALEMRLQGVDRVGLLLSGGFDSTLLAELMSREGYNFKSFSLEFEQGPAHNPRLENVLNQADWPFEVKQFDENDPVYLDRPDTCYFYEPNLHLFAPLLKQAASQGISRVFTGLGGDDLFSQPEIFMGSLLRENHWRLWWRNFISAPSKAATIASTVKSLIPTWAYRLLSNRKGFSDPIFALSDFELEALKKEIRIYEVERHSLSNLPHRRNLLAKFLLSGMAAFAFEQEQELAQDMGTLMSYPLMDYDLVRLVTSAPSADLAENFRDKGLLRRAFEFMDNISFQSYGEPVEKIWRAQSAELLQGQAQLQEWGILDQGAGLALSVDERSVIHYAYKAATAIQGSLHGKERKDQKALSKTGAEAVWLG